MALIFLKLIIYKKIIFYLHIFVRTLGWDDKSTGFIKVRYIEINEMYQIVVHISGFKDSLYQYYESK